MALRLLFFLFTLASITSAVPRTSGSNGPSPYLGNGESVYLGCFSEPDVGDLRFARRSDTVMTAELCVEHCMAKGYAFASVGNRRNCHCQVHLGLSKEVDESECSAPCDGNLSQSCGGENRFNRYGPPSLQKRVNTDKKKRTVTDSCSKGTVTSISTIAGSCTSTAKQTVTASCSKGTVTSISTIAGSCTSTAKQTVTASCSKGTVTSISTIAGSCTSTAKQTVTASCSKGTVTSISTIAGSCTSTAKQTVTLSCSKGTVTSISTVAGSCTRTATSIFTTSVPGKAITSTVTLPGSTATSATTVTVTVASSLPTCTITTTLLNGGFESGLDSWDVSDSYITADSNQSDDVGGLVYPHSGALMLSVYRFVSNDVALQTVRQQISLCAGRLYHARAYVYQGILNDTPYTFQICLDNSCGVVLTAPLAPGWVTYDANFVAQSDSAAFIMAFTNFHPAQTLLVDDVSIELA